MRVIFNHDAAIDELEHLLSIPSWITPVLLRADPRWIPLREHARFQRLLGPSPED